jgi:hypothetical protein
MRKTGYDQGENQGTTRVAPWWIHRGRHCGRHREGIVETGEFTPCASLALETRANKRKYINNNKKKKRRRGGKKRRPWRTGNEKATRFFITRAALPRPSFPPSSPELSIIVQTKNRRNCEKGETKQRTRTRPWLGHSLPVSSTMPSTLLSEARVPGTRFRPSRAPRGGRWCLVARLPAPRARSLRGPS